MDTCYQEKVCNCKRDCECEEGYECCSQQAKNPTLGLCVKKGTCNQTTGLCQTKKPGFIESVKELIIVNVTENYDAGNKKGNLWVLIVLAILAIIVILKCMSKKY